MITVFLDVDDLDDVTKVDDHVDRCSCMVVFCSGTYFNSRNCMGELRRAVHRGKPLVALLDVNAAAESPAAPCFWCRRPCSRTTRKTIPRRPPPR